MRPLRGGGRRHAGSGSLPRDTAVEDQPRPHPEPAQARRQEGRSGRPRPRDRADEDVGLLAALLGEVPRSPRPSACPADRPDGDQARREDCPPEGLGQAQARAVPPIEDAPGIAPAPTAPARRARRLADPAVPLSRPRGLTPVLEQFASPCLARARRISGYACLASGVGSHCHVLGRPRRSTWLARARPDVRIRSPRLRLGSPSQVRLASRAPSCLVWLATCPSTQHPMDPLRGPSTPSRAAPRVVEYPSRVYSRDATTGDGQGDTGPMRRPRR